MQQSPAGIQLLYVSEMPKFDRRCVKDYGLLESPYPPAIGMDKMNSTSWLAKYFIEFASNASIHGFNHLVAPRRHVFERILLVLSLLAAFGGLIGLSLDSWHRYQHESTILVLDNNFRKFEIAKPSVTICPINLLDEKKFSDVFKRYNITDTPEARNFLLGLTNLTYENIKDSIDTNFNEIEPELWLKLIYELRSEIKIVSQYSEEFIWISTERGLCMMFANYISEYSSVEYWLSNKLPKTANLTNNKKKAFFNVNNYGVVGSISCKTHDFWMAVHYPNTIIDYSTTGKIVRRVTLNSLTLSIVEVSSSKRVRTLSIQQRNCKLPKDAGLKMWPIYTYNMCKLECRYKMAHQLCGCVPHFAKPMKNVAICNGKQLVCISNHANEIISLKIEKLKACGCLQDCNEALYIDKESSSFALKEGSPLDAIMNLNIDFPQVKYIHEELFGFTDFLASIGGAAGLFLGASVLSFCEILYFATLRLLFYSRSYIRSKEKMKKKKQMKKY